MIDLRKISFILVSFWGLFVILGVLIPVQAQVRRLPDYTQTETDFVTDEATPSPRVERRLERLDRAVETLDRVHTRTGNEAVGEQVERTRERRERIKDRVATALRHMDERPVALRFLLGPDYKNAGEVRSEIVQTRNQIRQLQNLRENLGAQDQDSVDESISDLEAQANELEADLQQRTSGFSVFGWLNRLLSGY